MPSNRCQCKVQNKFTKQLRLCLNNKKIMNFCHIHSEINYTKYVVKIQSIYKGYYIRKKLKIYYKLPTDIQRKIIWHMNNTLYVKHFHSSVSKLIYKKLDDFVLKYNYNMLNVFTLENDTQLNSLSSDFFYELNHVIYLLRKYNLVINYMNIKNNVHIIKLFLTKIRYNLHPNHPNQDWIWFIIYNESL